MTFSIQFGPGLTAKGVIVEKKECGNIILDVDGLWYYWPPENPGAFTDYFLVALGMKMAEMNEPIRVHLEEMQ